MKQWKSMIFLVTLRDANSTNQIEGYRSRDRNWPITKREFSKQEICQKISRSWNILQSDWSNLRSSLKKKIKMQIFENNLSLFRSLLSFSLCDHPISHSDLPPPPRVSFPITSPLPGAISLVVYHSQFLNPPCDHTSPVTSHLVSLTFVSVYLFTCLPHLHTCLLTLTFCHSVDANRWRLSSDYHMCERN